MPRPLVDGLEQLTGRLPVTARETAVLTNRGALSPARVSPKGMRTRVHWIVRGKNDKTGNALSKSTNYPNEPHR